MAIPKPPTLDALFTLRLTLLDLLPPTPSLSQKATARPLLSALLTGLSSLPSSPSPSLSHTWIHAFSLHSSALLGPAPPPAEEAPAAKKRKLDASPDFLLALQSYETALSALDPPPLPGASLFIPLLSDVARATASHARNLHTTGDTTGALAALVQLSAVLSRLVEAFTMLVRRGGSAQMKEEKLMDQNGAYGDAWEGCVRGMGEMVELVRVLGEGVEARKRCEELGRVVRWFEEDLGQFVGRDEGEVVAVVEGGKKGKGRKSWVEQEGRDAVVWEVEQLVEKAAMMGFEIGCREVQQRRKAEKANLPALCETLMQVDEVKKLGERAVKYNKSLTAILGDDSHVSRKIDQVTKLQKALVMLWSLASCEEVEGRKKIAEELVVVRAERERLVALGKGEEIAKKEGNGLEKEKSL